MFDSQTPDDLAANLVAGQLRARGVSDQRVLEAMAAVPRHRFVPESSLADAYADRALPIACQQTISQPYMVALMTEALALAPGMKVLEIGTGSGYQTAILAHLGAKVTSVERYEPLAARARQTLGELGYGAAVEVVVGDGTLGWPAHSPYDRILVTAGAPHLPQAYREQLARQGTIVIPIGDGTEQRLVVVQRDGDTWRQHTGIGCRFVPLVGADGWSEGQASR